TARMLRQLIHAVSPYRGCLMTHEFKTRLNENDQHLVDEYNNTGVNREERKPFRPWKMMMWLAICIVGLGVAARIIGTVYLPY
ncbi:DUF3094 family protein, partial [Sansalvadorimonas verongulae]|uniref:DUF3094 family protein n=1 Tax=Sansalvadorimonas verongulae TaxID=2172824 RepID=UPI0012BCE60A